MAIDKTKKQDASEKKGGSDTPTATVVPLRPDGKNTKTPGVADAFAVLEGRMESMEKEKGVGLGVVLAVGVGVLFLALMATGTLGVVTAGAWALLRKGKGKVDEKLRGKAGDGGEEGEEGEEEGSASAAG